MNIPVQKLLTKMDAELQGAKKATSDSAIRERISSLKTLCELVLDEPITKSEERQVQVPVRTSAATMPMQVQMPMQPQQPNLSNQTKRLEMEDGANGESLWDF